MLIFVYNANSVGVVAVPDGNRAVGHGRKLSAMPPGVRPRAVIQRVANAVISDGFAVIGRQLVAPVAVTVNVIDGIRRRTKGAGSSSYLKISVWCSNQKRSQSWKPVRVA